MVGMDMRLSTLTTDIYVRQKAPAAVGWALSNDSYLHADATEAFRQRGHGRFTKSAIDPILSTDAAVSDVPLNAAFVAMVDRTSALGRLIALGAIPIPLERSGAARLQVGVLLAADVEEAAEKPVGRLDFRLAQPPRRTAAMIVVSSEAARSLAPEMQAGITNILAAAVVATSDRLLVSLLTAGTPAADATIGGVLATLVARVVLR